jgi:hypothetical protein
LALALVFSTFYLGYPSQWTSIEPPEEATKLAWFVEFSKWMEELVNRRTNYLRASLVALACGALFLPAAFVHVKTTPAAPPTKTDWPVAPSDNVGLQKVLYKAQVDEVAKLREEAAPASNGEFSIKEQWIWIAAAVALGIIILILLLGETVRLAAGGIPVPARVR